MPKQNISQTFRKNQKKSEKFFCSPIEFLFEFLLLFQLNESSSALHTFFFLGKFSVNKDIFATICSGQEEVHWTPTYHHHCCIFALSYISYLMTWLQWAHHDPLKSRTHHFDHFEIIRKPWVYFPSHFSLFEPECNTTALLLYDDDDVE